MQYILKTIFALSFVFQKLDQMGCILSYTLLSLNVRPLFLVLLLWDDDRFCGGKATSAPPLLYYLLVRPELIKR